MDLHTNYLSTCNKDYIPLDITNHIPLIWNSFNFINVGGDGNCLFRVFSYILYKNEDNFDEIRQELNSNLDNLNLNDFFTDDERDIQSQNRVWGSDQFISAFSSYYEINIYVYNSCSTKANYNNITLDVLTKELDCVPYINKFKSDSNTRSVYIHFINGNHYQYMKHKK